jgi:hypothetical protein
VLGHFIFVYIHPFAQFIAWLVEEGLKGNPIAKLKE